MRLLVLLRLLLGTKVKTVDGCDGHPDTPHAWTEELRAEHAKVGRVPRSEVVGAQPPSSYWTVGRRARMFSLMAGATEIETREEPGCETLLVPSQAP